MLDVASSVVGCSYSPHLLCTPTTPTSCTTLTYLLCSAQRSSFSHSESCAWIRQAPLREIPDTRAWCIRSAPWPCIQRRKPAHGPLAALRREVAGWRYHGDIITRSSANRDVSTSQSHWWLLPWVLATCCIPDDNEAMPCGESNASSSPVQKSGQMTYGLLILYGADSYLSSLYPELR